MVSSRQRTCSVLPARQLRRLCWTPGQSSQESGCFAWISPWSAVRVDCVPERACSDAQFNASFCNDVQGGCCLCEHCRWSHRKIADIGEVADFLCRCGEAADEGPGVEESAVVRMILNTDYV